MVDQRDEFVQIRNQDTFPRTVKLIVPGAYPYKLQAGPSGKGNGIIVKFPAPVEIVYQDVRFADLFPGAEFSPFLSGDRQGGIDQVHRVLIPVLIF